MKSLAAEIVDEIFDGLTDSTWRDKFEEAYQELHKYAEDMQISVQTILTPAIQDIKDTVSDLSEDIKNIG